jgi:hypothetical protein
MTTNGLDDARGGPGWVVLGRPHMKLLVETVDFFLLQYDNGRQSEATLFCWEVAVGSYKSYDANDWDFPAAALYTHTYIYIYTYTHVVGCPRLLACFKPIATKRFSRLYI